jgi:hypothetical protein
VTLDATPLRVRNVFRLRRSRRTLPSQAREALPHKYRRFPTAAEALRFAMENLRTPMAFAAWLQVDDERFNSIEIQRLYAADDYPLRKSDRQA